MMINSVLFAFNFSLLFFIQRETSWRQSLSCVLCQPSPILLSIISPTLSRLLLMQSAIAISVFLASISPPLSGHRSALLASFLSPIFFQMTSPCTSHQFLLRIFLHSKLHSHFIHFLYQFSYIPHLFLPGCFSQTWTFCCAIVSSILCMPG